MTDIVDRKTRSRMMAGIKGKNTKPELIVRSFLHSSGYRYRIHFKDLPGCPDIVMRKFNLAIFVHGCFWHRHQRCKFATNPEQNSGKWQKKFKDNINRDKNNIGKLRDLGWRVLVIWECGLKSRSCDLTWMTNLLESTEISIDEWPN